jgi:hypothetical protein
MTKQTKMMLRRSVPTTFHGGKWTYEVEEFVVSVMAKSGIYAMVRRKGCMPFVSPIKNLFDLEK